MEGNTMYYVLGGVAMLYLIVSIRNRQKSKDRKSRKFMSDYNRKKKK
ncbi:hypothetical protein CLV91_2363 [Maribacter vaceletii]|uniref:Uncharacterized protein n=1 Tax=Maribacter vaceletii TaxID=1206816 RepID=A0A495E8V5_9FLAO|nr:hypothetical protein [Maribacter vaceletii]RKR12237.1 hypothetical protein CLV91_2363 [Maribacter vaceletii]